MYPTMLTYVLLLAIGFFSFDAVTHSPDIIIDAEAVGTFNKTTINDSLVNEVLTQEIARIIATPTVMTEPVIRVGRLEGLAMSLAQTMNLQSVAYALQAQIGPPPAQIKLTLFSEDGTAKVLVVGSRHQGMTPFQHQVTLEPGESVVDLLQRATMIGMAYIDPYITALYAMQSHAEDKDFTQAQAIINFAIEELPPTPLSLERCLFENLNGLITLFNGDASAALDWFERAEDSCPDNTTADAVTNVNTAFAELQLDRDREAADHIEMLLRDKPPTDKIVLSTAYMTLAAAQLSLHDVNGADHNLAKAIEMNPESSIAYDLRSDIKREKGDEAEAVRLHRKALEDSGTFESYGEIAALYFRVAWRSNQPVMRSPFRNPELGPVRAAPRAR